MPTDRPAALAKILIALRRGRTLSAASRSAGINRATLHRWRRQDDDTDRLVRQAIDQGRQARALVRRMKTRRRRRVAVHPWCPLCGGKIQIRSAGRSRWWQCWRTKQCGWRSWRPRHRQDCGCGGYRVWSHSRQSVACVQCGARESV